MIKRRDNEMKRAITDHQSWSRVFNHASSPARHHQSLLLTTLHSPLITSHDHQSPRTSIHQHASQVWLQALMQQERNPDPTQAGAPADGLCLASGRFSCDTPHTDRKGLGI